MSPQKQTAFPRGQLGDVAQQYLIDAETEGVLTKASLSDYRSNLRRFAEAYPDATFAQFDGPQGTRLLSDFLATLPRDSRRKVISQLRSFFEFAIYYEHLRFDPSRRLKAPKPSPKFAEPPPSVETIQKIIDAQPFLDWRLAIKLAGMLGQRRGAVRGIQYKDFDLNSRHVNIVLKGQRPARNPLIYDDIVQAVEQLLQEGHHQNDYLLYPRKRNNLPQRKTDWILHPDRQLSNTAFTGWWRACLVRADLPHMRFHLLRHSAATELFRASGNIVAVKNALNHVKIETTMTYVNTGDIEVIDAHAQTAWRTP